MTLVLLGYSVWKLMNVQPGVISNSRDNSEICDNIYSECVVTYTDTTIRLSSLDMCQAGSYS